jgi:two-component system, cell cycle sensor histidine kinase and response regulator CckA
MAELDTCEGLDFPVVSLNDALEQELLRRSEELYRTIFETCGTAIIIINEDSTIQLTNSNFEKLSGYTREELEGKMSWTAFIAEEDLERMKSYHKMRRIDINKVPPEYEFRFINRHGEVRNILLNVAIIPNTNQSLASCMDITERKHAEEALRRSERSYRNIIESIQESYYEVDLKGNLTFFNPSTVRNLGYTEEELIGINFRSFMDDFHANMVFEKFNKLYVTGEQVNAFEWELIKKNGEKMASEASVSLRKDDSGNIVGFKGVVRDITERKESEKALRESEEKYRNILESIQEAYYEVDLKGNFTFFNDSMSSFFGYTRDELLGSHYSGYVDKEFVPRIFDVFHKVFLTGEPDKGFDWETIRKDGTRGSVESSVSLIRDSRGNPIGFRGVARDVTERKQAVEALRRSEERYRNILESIQDAYAEVDLQGRFLFFNDSLCRMIGHSREVLLGMNYRDIATPEVARKAYEFFHEIYVTGKPSTLMDYEVIRKDGTKRVFELSVSLMSDDAGKATGFRGLARDITKRKEAEEALRISEARFRDLAELLPETVYETDLKGRITFVNKSGLERFGYSGQDICNGLNVLDVVSRDERQMLLENIDKLLKGEKTGLKEYLVVRKNGTTFPVFAHSAPILGDGKPLGFRGFLVDISEKKNLEEQLLHAQRMESIGTLAGGVAHDFNNLLTGIQGNVSIMMMEIDKGGPLHKKRLENMERCVKRGTDLTRQLLGFARGGKYEVKVTDLSDFIRKSTDMFIRARKEIRLHLQGGKGIWPVDVDQGQMEQVLLNLYLNAWQAMPGGGDLYVGLENVDLGDDSAKPYELSSGRYVKVSVRDTGIGMDDAVKARIFDPFFTTKDRASGTGLGLASVYGIVKNHGGSIHVESKAGFGTEFMIFMPASSKDVEHEVAVGDEVEKGTGCILLVDDEEMILDVGCEMLSELGYRVVKARGGKEGLVQFQRLIPVVDLVILDMIMPDMSGMEVFERLKEIYPGVRVLLSSGYSLEGQAKEIMERGCRGFIQKPFSLQDLSKKIREVIDVR